jgi:undecaprenyl pyrophosphate phosphatase UppP
VSNSTRRLLLFIEAAASVLTGLLAVVTIFWHDWIEALTGWDPDHHNGSFEILIIGVLALVSVICGLAARSTLKRYEAQLALV